MNDLDNLNLAHLHSETCQMDVLVRYSLQSWLNMHPGEVDRFRGLYLSPQDMQNLLEISPGTKEEYQDTSAQKTEFLKEYQHAEEQSRLIEEKAIEKGVRLRLLHLKEYFGLSEFDYKAFILCLLPSLDLRYERIYGFLQDDVSKRHPGVNLLLSILRPTPTGLTHLRQMESFSATGNLVKYCLLRPLNSQKEWQEPRLNQLFEVPPSVVAWLLGKYFPEEPWLHLSLPEDIQVTPGSDTDLTGFQPDWEKIIKLRPYLAFEGMDIDRQERAARIVASNFGMPLLRVDLQEICPDTRLLPKYLLLMIRDACLHNAILFIQNWERALDENGFVMGDLLEEMSGFGGIFILGSRGTWRVSRNSGRPVYRMHFGYPNASERARLWEEALGESALVGAETLRNLVGQFSLTSGQIKNAAFSVKSKAQLTGSSFTTEDLFQAARQQSSHHLGELAQKIEPRYSWSDIILPPDELDILHAIVDTMRHRALVLEEWGLGRKLTSSAGVSALFTGDPGTGKTLAAQVIAAELKLDLYRINLSSVVSKYIGETEKNLERIFQEAHNSNAILFFDEADAIFGKRSEVKDAHDRYANIEVGYLLQRMETYDGVTILATNLRANIDEAFTRRLHFIVSFPFPDETQRLAIWKLLLPESMPVDQDIDWEYLAKKYPLTGGDIRNIVVSAAFMAAKNREKVNMNYLLMATRREMQKIGRYIREEDYRLPA